MSCSQFQQQKFLVFHHWVYVSCEFGLDYIEICSFYIQFVVFIMKRCWILSNAFLATVEVTIWFLSLILLMWSSTLLIRVCWSKLASQEKNLTWMYYPFKCFFDFGLLITCSKLFYLYLSRILDHIVLFPYTVLFQLWNG